MFEVSYQPFSSQSVGKVESWRTYKVQEFLQNSLEWLAFRVYVCGPLIHGFDITYLYDAAEKETIYAKRLKALAINLFRLEVYTVAKCLDKRDDISGGCF